MATVLSKGGRGDKEISSGYGSTSSLSNSPPLGAPRDVKKFFWQRKAAFDPDAIATQASVFDDGDTADKYRPGEEWQVASAQPENTHRFDPLFRWTWAEEDKVVRKIDGYIMVWACVMFMALELDRANISQALADNMLTDLHLTRDDYNLGNSIFRLSFLCAELPSQLVSKWMGPDRWIPTQMAIWSIVACSQFWLSGRTPFLACRALLGILQGGFIPDVILYLSYFYKHHELSIRLGWFWTAMSGADILSALLAYGLLRMRGIEGHAGWRWLFLVEGLLTLIVGLFAFLLMPAGPCQTASWFRGKNGWFDERQEKIIVNRVLREDPSKSSMHNREPITPKLLWQSLKDYDLWPLYLIGLTFQLPMIPPHQYLTLSLRSLGFDTFQTNLLSIPYTVGHIITILGITYLAEIRGELTFTAMMGQIWVFPILVYMAVTDLGSVNRWAVWAVTTVLLSFPNAHPIQVGWNSRNSNSVRLRTVSAACYNMFVQAGGVVGAQIYRAEDGPFYPKGNRVLLGLACMNIVLYGLVKLYYTWRNKSKAAKWDAMTPEQRLDYLANTNDEGNKRLDFRFQH
ncbi:MFS transporter [Gaeumannomyces tritici R3-111a-1]|uniref:MFS transporter n=1 Tax=Gaeumannomyces tritici (strain R3-111a-1) TaxID=644352 RepID=J3NPR7_GAET3|nr:MFS transporter [Gaeumannomyces tritici R3-111a-1]EJT78172.1 MFS transporter [Gaeumannomyces tritici R3-111a-1]